MKMNKKGFTFLELTIAIMILTVAIMSLCSTIVLGMRMDQMTEQNNIALDEASNKLEQIRSTDFDDIIDTWASDDSWPEGVKIGNFDIPGNKLVPTFADVDGKVGMVMIYTSELLWDQDAQNAGLPLDLNGNDIYEWGDLSTGFTDPQVLYPIVVKIEWEGIGGKSRSFSLRTLITKKD